jgi:hypothetical protein
MSSPKKKVDAYSSVHRAVLVGLKKKYRANAEADNIKGKATRGKK